MTKDQLIDTLLTLVERSEAATNEVCRETYDKAGYAAAIALMCLEEDLSDLPLTTDTL